ncbi:hypothetical protein JXA85_02650 [Candidatus Woesearchaeota archaeon]|nr:hypothetical protein [Candidatus Woesearchaeota archaeon]
MRKKISRVDFLIPLFVAVIVLSLVFLLRIFYSGGTLQGSEPYYNIRVAESIAEKGLIFRDNLVLSSRQTVANPFHVLLFLSSKIFGIGASARILPFIFGIASLFTFILILKHFSLKKREATIASILMILSPLFIWTFTTTTSLSLWILLDLLCFYFFIKEKRIFSFFLALLIIPFGFTYVLPIVLVLLLYSISVKRLKKSIAFISVVLISSLLFHTTADVPLSASVLAGSNYLNESISEFGGKSGFSPFFLILAISGMFFKSDSRAIRYSYAFIAVFLLLGTFVSSDFNILLCFGLAPLAAFGFIQTSRRKWELGIIKSFVLILFVCGIMFSAVAYSKRLAESKPDYPVMQSLAWFSENSDKNGFVFSHLNNGFWIETVGRSKVLFDPLSRNNEHNKAAYNETLQIYYSRNLKRTKSLLDKYFIKYIFIDRSMKQGLVWEDTEEGLLFLFNNNETFEKRYGISGVEIWEYRKN